MSIIALSRVSLYCIFLFFGIGFIAKDLLAQSSELEPYKAPIMKYRPDGVPWEKIYNEKTRKFIPGMQYHPDGITWGAYCEKPEGKGLAFGGAHRSADDGRPHTRIMQNGKWVSILEILRNNNPLQKFYGHAWNLRVQIKELRAKMRHLYFEDKVSEKDSDIEVDIKVIKKSLATLIKDLNIARKTKDEYVSGQVDFALTRLNNIIGKIKEEISPENIKNLRQIQIQIELAAEALDAEPPARVVSAMDFDDKTGLYILFGGDHYDYLTNDTWAFDPKKVKWVQRHPKEAPHPRGDHKLVSVGNGKMKLSGGYAYRYTLSYGGKHYGHVPEGEWTYDIIANTWTGGDKAHSPTARIYREGVFLPEYFLEGAKPDATAHEKFLKSIPVNTWISLPQSHQPKLGRDWSTAIIDVDHELILFWGGGHSSHGGTDVLHYHLSTNRWELTIPTEFPLGHLYMGGETYPPGFNFNGRPSMNGHTRTVYDYDLRLKKMIYAAPPYQDPHFYIYDPIKGDWSGRGPRPRSMNYYMAYHTIFMVSSKNGVYAWVGKNNKSGRMMWLNDKEMQWEEIELKGENLPTTRVDCCSIIYDSKRDRLLCLRGNYKKVYDGEVYEIDLKTNNIRKLKPSGCGLIKHAVWIRESAYTSKADLVLFACAEDASLEKTIAYDCAENRWIAIKTSGLKATKGGGTKFASPYGTAGSYGIGLRYDPKRDLFWAVNNQCQVWVMRLDLKNTDIKFPK